MEKYEVSIKWDDEESCFMAIIPGRYRLRAYGETRAEALKNLNIEAARHPEYVEGLTDSLGPTKETPSSNGRIDLKVPRSLHKSLSQAATKRGISLNAYIVTSLPKPRPRKASKKKSRE